MEFATRKSINQFEEMLENSYSLPIFKGYKAINTRGVEKFIDEIYANLPHDVQIAKEYLKNQNLEIFNSTEESDNIFDNLKQLESFIDNNNSFSFAGYIIVKINEIEKLLDKISSSLPKEITKVEKIDK